MSDSEPTRGATGIAGTGLRAVEKVLGVVADMSTPHPLMRRQTLDQVMTSAVLFGIGSVVFAMVRSFQAATPNPIADNVLTVAIAYGVLIFSGIVALRLETTESVLEDYAKFSCVTFLLLLIASALYAVLYGIATVYLGNTPALHFDVDQYIVRFSFAAVASLIVVGLLGWRSKRVHRAVWSQVTNKTFWHVFYIVLIAVSITIIASF